MLVGPCLLSRNGASMVRVARSTAVVAIAVFLLVLLAPETGWAQDRVALVIGNGAYRHVPTLPNPSNDASDIAASLERLGFAVRRIDRRRLRRDAPRAARVRPTRTRRRHGGRLLRRTRHGGRRRQLADPGRRRAEDRSRRRAGGDRAQERHARWTPRRSSASSSSTPAATIRLPRRCSAPCARARRPRPRAGRADRQRAGRLCGEGRHRRRRRRRPQQPVHDGAAAPPGDAGARDQFPVPQRARRRDHRHQREQEPFVYGSLSKEAIYLKTGPLPRSRRRRSVGAAGRRDCLEVPEGHQRRRQLRGSSNSFPQARDAGRQPSALAARAEEGKRRRLATPGHRRLPLPIRTRASLAIADGEAQALRNVRRLERLPR